MKLKNYFLTLFTGIFIGFVLSVLASFSFADILTPVDLSFAITKKYTAPLADDKIVGKVNFFEKSVEKESEFGRLLALASADSFQNNSVKNNKDKNNAVVKGAATKSDTAEVKDKKTEQIKDKAEVINSAVFGKKTIVFIGDSITDVMGTNLPYIKKKLQSYYPNVDFNLLNYGIGAQNIEQGLLRINSSLSYKDRNLPALTAVNPDIVVIESFAYNPFSDSNGELDRHWTALAKMVNEVKSKTNAKIIIMAAIAPAKAEFGTGPNGVNWPQDMAWIHAERISKLLENALNFAFSANLAFVDAYHSSLLSNGEGSQTYINQGDHIHQNEAGNIFMAGIFADKLVSLGWIN